MTMSIKQVAERLNIPISTIRYYDNMGLLPFIERDNNGYRRFTEDDLFWIDLVTCMRTVGMSITTLQHIITLHIEGPQTLPEIKEIFYNQKEKLLIEREKIEQAIYKVDKKMIKLDSLN
ncbi:MerR family transcriptional regulator [Bacillus thuringiensis]|uniref:MerR family transcriptional regulator n=1 Tax=Bacillus thuringiensis TaxID=1428 RepID=UPI0011A3CD3C|nr:MerR family transcriptional regulator [Bacillus thuringiensis]